MTSCGRVPGTTRSTVETKPTAFTWDRVRTTAWANLGWDRLYGEDGNDNLEGWSNGDYLDGGAGNDEIYAALLCSIGGNSYDTAGLMDSDPNELFGGPGDDYLVGDKGNDRLDGGEGYDVGQGGYRDGRIDWIESVDRIIDGCLPKFAN